MGLLPSIFDQCVPRREVLAGELSDAIFAADLWDVISGRAHAHDDYRDPARFFAGTYPTENLKFLTREVAERLAGMEGRTSIFRLETGFGGGKTHSLIATVHVARARALSDEHPRSQVNSQWATFLQTLFSVAARRPRTAVILTLPSEQDANRRLTGEIKQRIPEILETVDELKKTTARQARDLTPTQSYERAAVLGRRLFDKVDPASTADIARAYATYYEEQRDAGIQIDSRAFEPGYIEQIRIGYPFHPELIRLFAERLADIPEFQATRGALRLVARTLRAVWEQKQQLPGTLLLQSQHVDLARSEVRDEVLAPRSLPI